MARKLYSIKELGRFLKKAGPSKTVIVTSNLLKKKLNWALSEIPHDNLYVLPDGESAKAWGQIKKLLKYFTEIRLDRKGLVIALGGGTIGDASGFASAIYLRGMSYIQVPTTLLAQVDSAHGGKTGINFAGYKNQIGAFNNPLAIVIDVRFLRSLNRNQLIDGLGEVIKSGLIKDKSILELIRKKGTHVFNENQSLASIIKKTIAVKDYYIQKDPQENNLRQMLNAGHTVSHAVELKYNLSHGKAVLYGLLRELAVGESLGITKPGVRKNYEALLKELNIRVGGNLPIDWASLQHDKKISGNSIILPVIEKEGRAVLVKVPLTKLRKILSENLVRNK